MAFNWGGQAEGDSPASNDSSAGSGGVGGRGFWLGGGGGGGSSDRSEDESEGGYGLFNNDFAGYTNDKLSMDFWNLDDTHLPMSLGVSGGDVSSGSMNNSNSDRIGSNGQQQQQHQITHNQQQQQPFQTLSGQHASATTEDPVMKARKDILMGSSPDAMETFDDLSGFGSQ